MGDKMCVLDLNIAEARRMSEFMMNQKSRGFRDRGMERAAHEAEVSWGAPASIMLRLVRRDVSDMLLSNWLAVQMAYANCVMEIERRAQHQEHLARLAGVNAHNSGLYKAAALLGGTEDEGSR